MLNPNQDTYTNPLKLKQCGRGVERVQEAEDEKNSWKCYIVGMTQPLQPWSVSQHLHLPVQEWVPHHTARVREGLNRTIPHHAELLAIGRLWKRGSH